MKALKIGLHLDDLYDTRISTMMALNTAKAIEVVGKKGYGRRRGDWVIWEGMGITQEAWEKAYRTRDNTVLTKSVRSKLLGVLKEIIQGAEQGPRINPTSINVSLVLNEYPYRLAGNVKESITKLLRQFLHPMLKVDWVRQSPKQMTPARVVKDFTHFINYDMIPWLIMHMESDEPVNLIETELIGPALFQEKPNTEDFAFFNGVLDDVHQLSEQYVSPSWTIRFISVEYFNVPY